ncbi:MAG TPA: hypothetical protein VJH25_01290 [Candidatus Paceibacterota bacterium]
MNRVLISSKLFVRPSFTEGISRLLDLSGTLQEYNISKTEREADTKALKNDWYMVGNDLRSSIQNYEQELAEST